MELARQYGELIKVHASLKATEKGTNVGEAVELHRIAIIETSQLHVNSKYTPTPVAFKMNALMHVC